MPSTLITEAIAGSDWNLLGRYLADGWQVYAPYRGPASASESRRLAGDGKLQILQRDVTDLASVAAAAEVLKNEAVDLLLNNAGLEALGVSLLET